MAKLNLPPTAKYAIGIAVAVVVWAVIGVGIGLVEMYNTGGTPAAGTFTFSGNVTSSQWVNITNPATNTIYTLEFNATRNALGELAECAITNCIVVNLTIGFNNSYRTSGNLTNVINDVNGYGNASLAALVTAVNTSQTTTITADTAGTAGNSITLSDNAGTITSSTMSGGTTPNPTPSTVMVVARLAVAIFASLGVMIRFLE